MPTAASSTRRSRPAGASASRLRALRGKGGGKRPRRPRPARAPRPPHRLTPATLLRALRPGGGAPRAPGGGGWSRRRIVLTVVLALVAVLVPSYLVLRDSALFEVRDVYVVGLRSEQRDEIREQLRDAALEMSTLHVDHDAFAAIARRYTSIAEIRTDAELPHGLTIEVVERVPVATVSDGKRRLPVTAAGVTLATEQAEGAGPLPRVDIGGPVGGRRVSDRGARAAIALLAAAPPELRRRVARAHLTKERGFVLELRNGIDLVFGAVERLEAKWLAAAAVLADASSHGASAVDVRIPDRPAAAGVAPDPDQEPPPPGAGGGQADVSPQTESPQPPAAPPTQPDAQSPAPAPTPTPAPDPVTPPATGDPSAPTAP